MPRKPVHDLIGGGAGIAAAGLRATQAGSSRPVLEVGAGAFGGVIASRWPDHIEPASCGPRHRAFAHSVTSGCLVSSLPIEKWQATLRTKAANYERLAAATSPESFMHLWYRFLAWCCFAVAGLIAGMQAGYLSHLIADGTSAAGLPFLGYSFA